MNRITEAQIQEVVSTFYDQVRDDPLLGPVFEARLAGRWEPHLEKMCDFWSSVLLATGRFRGNPLESHAALEGLTSAHFDRWIELFDETANQVLPDVLARDIVGRSQRMRVVLERATERGPSRRSPSARARGYPNT